MKPYREPCGWKSAGEYRESAFIQSAGGTEVFLHVGPALKVLSLFLQGSKVEQR